MSNSIDIEEMARLLDEGKTGAECARYFGVSPSAVSKARKKIKRGIVRHVATERAPAMVDRGLDIFDQLNQINSDAREILDLCMRWQRGDDVAIQIMESQVRQINVGTRDEPEIVEEFKFKDPREIALRAMAEIRQQLGLQKDLFKQLYELQEVRLFMDVVLEVMRNASPELCDKLLAEFKRRQLVRSAFSIH